MTHRLATNCAKNYCNRTLIVKVIVENVVTCFFGTRCIVKLGGRFLQKLRGMHYNYLCKFNIFYIDQCQYK